MLMIVTSSRAQQKLSTLFALIEISILSTSTCSGLDLQRTV